MSQKKTPREVYEALVKKMVDEDFGIREANIYAVQNTWRVYNEQ